MKRQLTEKEITHALDVRFWFWFILTFINAIIFGFAINPNIIVDFTLAFSVINLIINFIYIVWWDKQLKSGKFRQLNKPQ